MLISGWMLDREQYVLKLSDKSEGADSKKTCKIFCFEDTCHFDVIKCLLSCSILSQVFPANMPFL